MCFITSSSHHVYAQPTTNNVCTWQVQLQAPNMRHGMHLINLFPKQHSLTITRETTHLTDKFIRLTLYLVSTVNNDSFPKATYCSTVWLLLKQSAAVVSGQPRNTTHKCIHARASGKCCKQHNLYGYADLHPAQTS